MPERSMRITWALVGKNALRFLFSVGYSMVFPMIFGMENVLPSVALCVGLTMLPWSDLSVRPRTMAGILVALYLGCGLAAQAALLSRWAALPLNLLFTAGLLLLTCEPKLTKPSISFLLCFVFCQAVPVPADRLPMRLLGLLAGSLITAAALLLSWNHRGYGAGGRSLPEQVRHCAQNRTYILRMSAGLAAAMFIGMSLHLRRPLWISIVVMSLTQMDLEETVERIKLRTVGTVIGIAVFIVLFGLLIPRRYSMAVILLMGYLSFFTSDYKHKTVVNAVCAINAALALMDTGSAIQNRVFCLLLGIAIVVALWAVQRGGAAIRRRLSPPSAEPPPRSGHENSAQVKRAEPAAQPVSSRSARYLCFSRYMALSARR